MPHDGPRVRGGRGLWGSGCHSQPCGSSLYMLSNLSSVPILQLRSPQLPQLLWLTATSSEVPAPRTAPPAPVPLVGSSSPNVLSYSETFIISIPKSQQPLSCQTPTHPPGTGLDAATLKKSAWTCQPLESPSFHSSISVPLLLCQALPRTWPLPSWPSSGEPMCRGAG